MAKPTLRFTATPDVGATVRLDLHQEGCWTDPREWEWGMPTLLGDPDGVGSAYGLRTLKFVWYIEGSKAQATARLSDLARALLRDGSYLQFQIDNFGAPAWFQLVRSEPGAPSLRWVRSDTDTDVWAVDVSLQAEPFILGAQESFTLTIPTDPATTNAMTAVLPTIKGDAPAPLVMDLPAPGSGAYTPIWTVVAVESWAGAQWFPINSSTSATWDALTGTTLGAGGATVTMTSNGGAFDARVKGKITPPLTGRWRVMVQVSVAASTSVDITRAGVLASSIYGAQMVDTGVDVYPANNIPTQKPYTLSPPPSANVFLNMRRATGSGTTTAVIQGVLLVPVDLPLDAVGAPVSGRVDRALDGGSATSRLDGEAEQINAITAGAHLDANTGPAVLGGFARVSPGGINILHLIPQKTTAGGTPVQETAVLSVPCTYRPRWLFLAAS